MRLNEKHGLNPTIAQCPICAGEKNEIALLGNAMKEQAPMKMVIDNEPCDECKEMMNAGILIISVRDGSDKNNPFRTGLKAAIREEAFEKIFGDIPKQRVAFIEDGALKKTGLYDMIKRQAEDEKNKPTSN
jgi:deoxycytidylate deaminase